LITVLEKLLKKYNSWKNHLLNQKKVTMIDTQQILFSEEIKIKTDQKVDVKSDWILIVWKFKQITRKTEYYNCEELKYYACDCIKLKCCMNDFLK